MLRSLPKVTIRAKPFITPGNVTVSNVTPMRNDDDHSWRKLPEPWQRVLWARERWQRRTAGRAGSAAQAADALGMGKGTYKAYERAPDASKHTPLTAAYAEKFGRLFGVSWLWLLRNEGTPFGELSPQIARVVAAMEAMTEDQQKAIADMITAFEHRTGTNG